MPSAVELTDLLTKETASKVQTDERGNYLITLPVGRDYAFNVNRKGYLFYSGNFPLSQKPLIPPIISIFHFSPGSQRYHRAEKYFFDVNRFNLRPESQIELSQVVALMKENPTLNIQINGHTDNAGKTAETSNFPTTGRKPLWVTWFRKASLPNGSPTKGLAIRNLWPTTKRKPALPEPENRIKSDHPITQ